MMTEKMKMGYVEVEVLAACPLFPSGCSARGHVYHFSEIIQGSPQQSVVTESRLLTMLTLEYAMNRPIVQDFISTDVFLSKPCPQERVVGGIGEAEGSEISPAIDWLNGYTATMQIPGKTDQS